MCRDEVLTGGRNFNLLYKKGKSVSGKHVVIIYRKNNLLHNRIGYLASKKVGNAVKRNRAKRLMKEAVRLSNPIGKTGYDIAFIARVGCHQCKCEHVIRSIESSMKRTDLR